MNKTERHIRYVAIVIMVVAFPLKVSAQWNFDIVSVEAYINDHKQQRSLLLARSTLELSNQLLHEYSSEAAVDFKELNVDLDKYTRAFDVIDILYQSLRTSLNVYSTYNSVSDRVGDYKDLLDDYYTKVVERNRMELMDTLIIGISLRCVQRIAEDGKQLYRSDERPCAVCHRGSGLFHLGLAVGTGKHQPRTGQHRAALEQSLF